MKNIVIVSSSYRENGNSNTLAIAFGKGATESGNLVEYINLRDKHMEFCRGCLSCGQSHRCIIDDDITDYLKQVSYADVLVFATPIYYYEMSGQLKTFLDRMNPLYGFGNHFKEVYVLMSAQDENPEAMDNAVNGIKGWISCFDEVELKGEVRAVKTENLGDVSKTPFLIDAYQLGKSIK